MKNKYKTVKLPKELLLEILYEDREGKISDKIDDHSRWSVHHTMIFAHEDKFYSVAYSKGATEYQDESPWQYEDDMVTCYEVVPIEIRKTIYDRIIIDD
jgi:hypothetical protein